MLFYLTKGMNMKFNNYIMDNNLTPKPTKKMVTKKLFIIPVAILVLFLIIGLLSSSAKTSPTTSPTTSKIETDKKTPEDQASFNALSIAEQVEKKLNDKYANSGANKIEISIIDHTKKSDGITKNVEPPFDIVAFADFNNSASCSDSKLLSYNFMKDTLTDEFYKNKINSITFTVPNKLSAGLGIKQFTQGISWSGQTNFWEAISKLSDEPKFGEDHSNMVFGKLLKSCK